MKADATADSVVPAKSIWFSAGVVFVGNVVARGLGFLFPVVLAHATSRTDFALAYFFINTGFAVGEIVLAGYPVALTRVLASPAERGRPGWLTSAVVPALPLLVIAIIGGELLSERGQGSAALMSLVIVGLTIDAFYFSVLRGLRRFGLLVVYRITGNLAQLLLLLGLLTLGPVSATLAVAIYALVYLVPIAVIEVIDGPARRVLLPQLRPSADQIRSLTRFAVPALISGSAYAAVLGLDVFFVRVFAPGELPEYGAARSLAMPMSLVSFAIGATLMPGAAAAVPSRQMRLLGEALAISIGAAALAIAAYVALAPTVVAIVFPDGYEAAGALLPVLAVAIGAVGIYSVLSQWWLGIGRPWPPAACLVAGAIVAVAGQRVLTGSLGGAGAAASVFAGAAAAFVLLGIATLSEQRRRHSNVPASGSGIIPT